MLPTEKKIQTDGEQKSVFNILLQDESGSINVTVWNAPQYEHQFQIGDALMIQSPRVQQKKNDEKFESGGTGFVELVCFVMSFALSISPIKQKSVDGNGKSFIRICHEAISIAPLHGQMTPLIRIAQTNQKFNVLVMIATVLSFFFPGFLIFLSQL